MKNGYTNAELRKCGVTKAQIAKFNKTSWAKQLNREAKAKKHIAKLLKELVADGLLTIERCKQLMEDGLGFNVTVN